MERRPGRHRLWRYLLLGGPLLATMGGCGTPVDREQARVCRLVAVALLDGEGPLRVVAQRTVPSFEVAASGEFPRPPQPTGVALTVSRGPDDSSGPASTLSCAFADAAGDHRLIAVRTAAGPLPIPAVVMLDRFWISNPEAASLDPQPVAGTGRELRLPRGTGYATQQWINALPSAAIYALLAVAYALVYGLIGRINLAFGAFAAVGGTATLLAVLAVGPRGGLALAILAAAVAAIVPAIAHGVTAAAMVFRPLRRSTGQQGLVATIGLALGMGEYLRLVQGPQPRWLAPILDEPWALARDGAFVVTITPLTVAVSGGAIVASLGLVLAMRQTSFGRNWRAFRDDAACAALFGVAHDRLLAQTFAVAAAFAGLAGGITVLIFGELSFAYAQVLGLKALAAAVLGGIGSVGGALLGGLLIGALEALWSSSFPITNRDLAIFITLVLALVFRPGGLFGERDLLPRRV